MRICENFGRNGQSDYRNVNVKLLFRYWKSALKQAQYFIWTSSSKDTLCKTRLKIARGFWRRIWKYEHLTTKTTDKGANFRRAHPNLRLNSSVWNIINMFNKFVYVRPSQMFFSLIWKRHDHPCLLQSLTCTFIILPWSVNENFSIWVKNSRKRPINNGQTHYITAFFSWPWSNKDALVCHIYCERNFRFKVISKNIVLSPPGLESRFLTPVCLCLRVKIE